MRPPEDPGIDLRIDHVKAILRRTPDVLLTWLGGLPEPWLENREGPETWSPHEIVGHLVHGEKTDWMPRLRQMLEGRSDEPFEPFDRFAMLRLSSDRSPSELLAEFEALRAANLSELEELPLSAGRLDDPGLHPELGPVTVGQLLATWATHDLTHLAQIARVMAKQYRVEVGPWRAYLPLLDRPVGRGG